MRNLKFQYFIANLIYIFGHGLLQTLSRFFFVRRNIKNPQNVLIFRTGNLGDTFCAVPAIKAVQKKFPNSRFIFMTTEASSGLPHPVEVLKGIIEFQEIITYNPAFMKNLKYLFGIIIQLKRKRPDLIIYLSQSDTTLRQFLRDMFFFKVAGCKSAYGFQWTKHRFFPISQRYHRSFNREVARLMNIVVPLGINRKVVWDIPDVPLDFNWPSTEIFNPRPIIAIHPSAKFPVNRWPIDRFIEVGRILQEKYNTLIVLIGDEETKPEAKEIEAKIGHGILNLAGKTPFLQLVAVLKRCNLLISNDSGPVHVASAVGTPVVGIYSARDYPECWYPWGNQHIILRKDPSCQVCLKAECETMECIKNITAKEVLQACEQVLTKNRRNITSTND